MFVRAASRELKLTITEIQRHTGPQRGKGRVKAALMEAALKLFSERHADGVTIDDIVGAARVAKGSFYNYFSDKDDLVVTLLNETRNKIEMEVASINDSYNNSALRICRAICVYVRFFFNNPTEFMFLIRNDQAINRITLEDLNRGLRADVRAGLQSGEISIPSVDAGTLFIIGISNIAMQAAIQAGDRTAVASRVQQICKLMLRGLGTEESKAELFSSQAVEDVLHD